MSILSLGFLALADGPVADWTGRVGKILLLMAGLAILLDLVGPERLARWADRAAKRRDRLGRESPPTALGGPNGVPNRLAAGSSRVMVTLNLLTHPLGSRHAGTDHAKRVGIATALTMRSL
jgi:hypothetical protein